VHSLAEPDRLLTLSVIDSRSRFGAWVAALTEDGEQDRSSAELVSDALSVPSRPRQATSHKSMTAGDELLIHVARCLESVANGDEVVGRLGGDEFVLLCPGPDNPERTMFLAERLQSALNQPLHIAAGMVELHASIGVAFNVPGDTCDVLLARADSAMYQSKRGGGATVALYSHSDECQDFAATVSTLLLDADEPAHRTHVRSAPR
jgi:predicted signal transduction protein with EAL and GGDEF domain